MYSDARGDAPRFPRMDEKTQEVAALRAQAKILKGKLPLFGGDVPCAPAQTVYRWIEELCATPHRRAGTPEGHQAEAWLLSRFKELGLQDVAEDRIPIAVWTPRRWSLKIAGSDVDCFFMLNTAFTGRNGITAPLVYVGAGTKRDYDRVEVTGKIAVVEVSHMQGDITALSSLTYFVSDPKGELGQRPFQPGLPDNITGSFGGSFGVSREDAYANAVERGAAGVVAILGITNNTLYWPYDATLKSVPGLFVGRLEGDRLREAATEGIEATLVLEGEVADGYMANVWGILPGRSDEIVMVSAHQDAPHKGATQDGLGIGQVLAQIWGWSQVPQRDRARTLAFVATAGHMYGGRGAFAFAEIHPDIMDRVLAAIDLGHTPSREVIELEDGKYSFTGRAQPSMIFVTSDAWLVAAIWRAVDTTLPPATVCLRSPMIIPPTDVGHLVQTMLRPDFKRKQGIAYMSWLSAPAYMLTSGDGMDKIDVEHLPVVTETVTEIIKNLMALEQASLED